MKPVVPIHGVPGQNMKAKPHSQKVTPHMQVSAMPSTRMLTVSRERANPDSSMTKPTCMQNTRYAATSVHTVLMALIVGGGSAGVESAYAVAGKYHLEITATTMARPIILPTIRLMAFFRTIGLFQRCLNRLQVPAMLSHSIFHSPGVFRGARTRGL